MLKNQDMNEVGNVANDSQCPACASGSIKFLRHLKGNYTGLQLNLYQCSDCLTLFNPSPYQEDDAQMLREVITHVTKRMERNLRWADKLLTELLILNPEAKTHLDIGTAIGTILRVSKKFDLDAVGIDANPYAISYSRRNFNLNLRCGKFESAMFANKFDIITLCSVLEHFNHPRPFFKDVLNCLNKNGVLFVAVPFYLPDEHSKYIDDPYVEGSDLKDPDVHVVHFTHDGMVNLLKDFNASYIKKIVVGWLGYVAKFN